MQTHEVITQILLDGTLVKKTVFETILQSILDVLPAFMANEPYNAADLIGPDLWSGMNKGEHIIAGKCVAYMARNCLIPFHLHGCAHKHTYMLKV